MELAGPKATGTPTAIFDSSDFITAFVDGGYELGPRTDVAAVPEPSGTLLWVIGLPLWLIARRTRRAV